MTVFSQRWIAAAAMACTLWGCDGGSDSATGVTNTGANVAANRSQIGGNGSGSNLPAASWTSVKWGGGGYVTGLIYHPVNASLLYARTDVGGAYRWNATNSTWTPITDGIGFGSGEGDFHGVESLALDPNNDQLVYMVTGITVTQGHNGRIYISSNRGDTWTHYDLPFPVGGNDNGRATSERLQVDPNNPSTLFYGSRTAGLWKSADSGRTWTQVTGLSSTTISGGSSPIGVEQVIFDTSGKGWPADLDHVGHRRPGLRQRGGPDVDPVQVHQRRLLVDAGARPADGVRLLHPARRAHVRRQLLRGVQRGRRLRIGGPSYLYKFGGSNDSNWTLLNRSSSNGFGGLSVSGLGASARIALGMTGWSDTSKTIQLSDDGGSTWREIEAGMPHIGTASAGCAGWVEGVAIDPANRDHVMHVHGAASAKP